LENPAISEGNILGSGQPDFQEDFQKNMHLKFKDFLQDKENITLLQVICPENAK